MVDCLLQITTARKAVTLVLSYIIFAKPLLLQHSLGMGMITAGIVLKMLPESKGPKLQKASESDDVKYSALEVQSLAGDRNGSSELRDSVAEVQNTKY